MMAELVRYMARRVAGQEGDALAAEVEIWIRERLDPDYAWPGNYRELEQCVRNVLIRKNYIPPVSRKLGPLERLCDDVRQGRLAAGNLLGRYCAIVYADTGSYEETGRRLQLDRRTVKDRSTGNSGGTKIRSSTESATLRWVALTPAR